MPTAHTLGVLVGIDGSAASIEAAEWAAAEATSLGVPLTLAYVVPQLAEFDPGELLPEETAAGKRLLQDVAERFRCERADLEVRTVLRAGPPGEELLRLAADASLVVIGARGHGGFPELLIGSVSMRVAADAPCPSVVVHGGSPPPAGAPIVVGTDGSRQSNYALEYAFATADRLGGRLLAIRTYPVHPVMSLAGAPRPLPTERYEEATREALADTLFAFQEKHPAVVVQQRVFVGSPAAALVEASRRARLVVVGDRGRRGLRGVLLGSVSRQVLHHAHCPVAVVRQ